LYVPEYGTVSWELLTWSKSFSSQGVGAGLQHGAKNIGAASQNAGVALQNTTATAGKAASAGVRVSGNTAAGLGPSIYSLLAP
jgi:hypothetical protein